MIGLGKSALTMMSFLYPSKAGDMSVSTKPNQYITRPGPYLEGEKREKTGRAHILLRGGTVNRTYGTHKNLHIFLFFTNKLVLLLWSPVI